MLWQRRWHVLVNGLSGSEPGALKMADLRRLAPTCADLRRFLVVIQGLGETRQGLGEIREGLGQTLA